MSSLRKDLVPPPGGRARGSWRTKSSQDRPVPILDRSARGCDILGLGAVIRALSPAATSTPLQASCAAVILGLALSCQTDSPGAAEDRRTDFPEVATETPSSAESPATTPQSHVDDSDLSSRRVLFDPSLLGDWETGVFGNPDEFDTTDEGVVIPQTSTIAGMTYRGTAPTTPYVMHVDVTKRYGDDFFLGLTFPVRDSHLTLVLGGWGGGVSGLSCIDGKDASDNATRHVEYFPNGKRQMVVLDVTDTRVVARLDGRVLVDADLTGKELGLRTEVLASRPVGVATFATCSLIHSITVDERP